MLKGSYRRGLVNDERLVKVLHHHWSVIALPIAFAALLVVALLTILFTIFDNTLGKVLFYLLLIVGVIAWCRFALPSIVRWYTKSYAITTRKVLFRDGIFNRSQVQIDLVRVARTTVHRSGWDNLLGSGTIDLGEGFVLKRIPKVQKMDQLLNQLVATQTEKLAQQIQILNTMGYKV